MSAYVVVSRLSPRHATKLHSMMVISKTPCLFCVLEQICQASTDFIVGKHQTSPWEQFLPRSNRDELYAPRQENGHPQPVRQYDVQLPQPDQLFPHSLTVGSDTEVYAAGDRSRNLAGCPANSSPALLHQLVLVERLAATAPVRRRANSSLKKCRPNKNMT